MRLLYVTREPCPTFRADVAVLFGKYLPRHGVMSDIVSHREPAYDGKVFWGGGEALVLESGTGRAGKHIRFFLHSMRHIIGASRNRYDAVQVRDLPMVAALGLIICRIKRLRFIYWMSYPAPEGQIELARMRGLKRGLDFLFPWIRGHVGKWLAYNLVLPNADHVFVQSRRMLNDLAALGLPSEKLTPVPMGVDLELACPEAIAAADDPRLSGKRIAIYLGTLDRPRKIEMLFEMMSIVRRRLPDVLLVIAGGTKDKRYFERLKQRVRDWGVEDIVLFTGWLPTMKAWRYVRAAEVGLSPFPRGPLLDSCSPTKAIEYMALNVPVIVNDQPDQEQVVMDSGAGLCVPWTPKAFADALLELLADKDTRRKMAGRGRAYVAGVRGYDRLGARVAQTYRSLVARPDA